ncbi:Cytochrome P450 78A6 [Bienertia sinuspersici]
MRNKNGPFEAREVLKWASLSNMMGSVFGEKNLEGEELLEMVEEGYDLLGILNLGDHLSWLSEFDFQKIRFRCSQLVPKVNRFVGRIIENHRSNPAHVNRDFVDVLLSLQHTNKLSDSDMIAVLWRHRFNSSVNGMDSCKIVLHPNIQSKVHDELDNVVGRSRAVTESDLPSLVYLTAVIKEVLRLHPPGPLLAWSRLSIEDSTLDGYHVPAGTTATVNMWAIARIQMFGPVHLSFSPIGFWARRPVKSSQYSGRILGLHHLGRVNGLAQGRPWG